MTDTALFASSASISTRASTESLMLLLQDRNVLDITVLESNPPFFWLAEISNNKLDAYYTKMSERTLRNFAMDAGTGVSFQNSHNVHELGFGRSLTGVYIAPQADGVIRIEADFYTIPNLRLNNVSTNDFILGVRAGVIRDVSVGFTGGQFLCGICGRNMMRDWDCTHIPGMMYPILDRNGNVTGEQLAFAWVDDAHLVEVSAVYDGATPGAAILKAQQEATNGRITPNAARFIEQRYRVRLPTKNRIVQGVLLNQTGLEQKMIDTSSECDNSEQADDGANIINRVVTVLDDVMDRSVETPDDVAAGMRALVDEINHLRASYQSLEKSAQIQERTHQDLTQTLLVVRSKLSNEYQIDNVELVELVRVACEKYRAAIATIEQLTPLADDGTIYRQDLLNEAMTEGVRAFGIEFATETYRGLLSKAELSVIKRMRDDWRVMADRQFPAGRKTQDDVSVNTTNKSDSVSVNAYRS